MAANKEIVQDALDAILQLFESGDLPEAMAHTVIEGGDRPIQTWSIRNQLLAWLAGTVDGRTYNDWKKVGRHVVKGSKAFWILAPLTFTVTDEETGEKEIRVRGFKASPRFRYTRTGSRWRRSTPTPRNCRR